MVLRGIINGMVHNAYISHAGDPVALAEYTFISTFFYQRYGLWEV